MQPKGRNPEVDLLLFPFRADHLGKVGYPCQIGIRFQSDTFDGDLRPPERQVNRGISFSGEDFKFSGHQTAGRRIPRSVTYPTEKEEAFPPPLKRVSTVRTKGRDGSDLPMIRHLWLPPSEKRSPFGPITFPSMASIIFPFLTNTGKKIRLPS